MSPRPPDTPEGLGDILGREVKRATGEKKGLDRARDKWKAVVGPGIAPKTAVVSYKAHVLRVRVESSALLQELAGIYKRELMAAMATGENPVSLRSIEFELAGGSHFAR